jgi:hypothetical protein
VSVGPVESQYYRMFHLKPKPNCYTAISSQNNKANLSIEFLKAYPFAAGDALLEISTVEVRAILWVDEHPLQTDTSCHPTFCYLSVYCCLIRYFIVAILIDKCFTKNSRIFCYEVLFKNEHTSCSWIHHVCACTTFDWLCRSRTVESIVTDSLVLTCTTRNCTTETCRILHGTSSETETTASEVKFFSEVAYDTVVTAALVCDSWKRDSLRNDGFVFLSPETIYHYYTGLLLIRILLLILLAVIGIEPETLQWYSSHSNLKCGFICVSIYTSKRVSLCCCCVSAFWRRNLFRAMLSTHGVL